MKRVVVTGMGALTPVGDNWTSIAQALKNNLSGIRAMPEWIEYKNLGSRVAGQVEFDLPDYYPRKKLRTMGRVSQLAVRATELALEDAGLLDDPVLISGRCGLAYGSTTGSTDAAREYAQMLTDRDLTRVSVSNYIRMMSHTAAVNVGLFFGLRGRVYPTSCGCTSGSQGIGYAYEAIQSGRQSLMLAGGAEELCPSQVAVFDTFHSASRKNDTPTLTPSPFDRDRDGLVIGEGAGTLVLEEYQHARDRGAHIYAEIVGYGTNTDGSHVTLPNADSMQVAMQLALENAGIQAADIGWINAHGTATGFGDLAESQATAAVFGENTAVTTQKGHTGHTLGACGAIEAVISIQCLREGWVPPILNLRNLDPQCAPLDYIQNEPRAVAGDFVISNNFAFGGVNTSLIFTQV